MQQLIFLILATMTIISKTCSLLIMKTALKHSISTQLPQSFCRTMSKWRKSSRLDAQRKWEGDEEDVDELEIIYGVNPISLALSSSKRVAVELFVQERLDISNRKDDTAITNILKDCENRRIPLQHVSRHELNMITDNKLHQGFALRATRLYPTKIESLDPSFENRCVLALDEVWDPQNLGALIRTAHFLGVDKVVVCAKNSAPLSAAVSKASAGALEVSNIYVVTSMTNFLEKSRNNNWQVVGTSLGDDAKDIKDIPIDRSTVLVLGNEGHGIRTNVLRKCSSLVKLSPGYSQNPPSGSARESSVDSLNVSVTGGILLHHILGLMRK